MPRGQTVYYKQGHFWGLIGVFLASLGLGVGLNGHPWIAHAWFAVSFLAAAIALWIMMRHYGCGKGWYVLVVLILAGGIFELDHLPGPTPPDNIRGNLNVQHVNIHPVEWKESGSYAFVSATFEIKNIGQING